MSFGLDNPHTDLIIIIYIIYSDINECTTKPCSQVCANLPGTYTCSCNKGYIKPSTTPTDSRCNGKYCRNSNKALSQTKLLNV